MYTGYDSIGLFEAILFYSITYWWVFLILSVVGLALLITSWIIKNDAIFIVSCILLFIINIYFITFFGIIKFLNLGLG